MRLIKYIKLKYRLYKIKKRLKPKYNIGEMVAIHGNNGSKRLVRIIDWEYTQIYTSPIVLYKVQDCCLYSENVLRKKNK